MADDILTELNRDFYEHSPTQYLRTRIALLLALSDESRPVHGALSSGLEAWGIRVQTPEGHDQEEIDGFAVVESISLMYLAAEALLRLFLAHRGPSNCPPLSLAEQTDFRAFKKELAGLLASPPSVDEVHHVFRGSADPVEGIGEQAWAEDGEVLQFLVARAADLLVNRANVYNSVKHGLAVQPRNSAFRMGSPDSPGGVVIDHSGTAVRFLSRVKNKQKGTDDWSEHIEFVFPATNLSLAAAFADEIDAIRDVGHGRLFGGQVHFILRNKAFITSVMNVPFRANYTGLMRLEMVRTFSLRPAD